MRQSSQPGQTETSENLGRQARMPRSYRIGEAAHKLDLKTCVLRFWEDEFPQLLPKRTPKGQRLYSEADLKLLGRIKFLLHEQGMTIDGARRVLAADAKNFEPFPAALPEVQEVVPNEVQDVPSKASGKAVSKSSPKSIPGLRKPGGSQNLAERLLRQTAEELESLCSLLRNVDVCRAEISPAATQGVCPFQAESQVENQAESRANAGGGKIIRIIKSPGIRAE